MLGSGCGAVGRAVASDTRDPRFECSHQNFYLLSYVLKILAKRPGMAQFLKKQKILYLESSLPCKHSTIVAKA